MSHRVLLPLAAGTLAIGLLTGCAGPAPLQSPLPSATPSASASPTPPAEVAELTVTIDGISFADASGSRSATFDEGAALIALLQEVTGELPVGEPLEGPYGGDSGLVRYAWDGISAIVSADRQGRASVAVTASEVGAVPIVTDHGLRVGSSRSDLLATGASTLTEDGDQATATELRLGGRDVPDTSSLARPGSVGQEFTLFLLDGDAVTQIQMPSNDFADI